VRTDRRYVVVIAGWTVVIERVILPAAARRASGFPARMWRAGGDGDLHYTRRDAITDARRLVRAGAAGKRVNTKISVVSRCARTR
jgi:hypothetical protein